MEELVVSAHEFESFSKWYRYREPVVSGCVQGVSSTRNIHSPFFFAAFYNSSVFLRLRKGISTIKVVPSPGEDLISRVPSNKAVLSRIP